MERLSIAGDQPAFGVAAEAGTETEVPAAPRWFTSDLHLGHGNIIKHCDRPFADADEMDRALIDNWNSVVGENDDVWVLGDFSMGGPRTVEMVSELNGNVTLLSGNHDRCWQKDKEAPPEYQVEKYLKAGFARIWQGTLRCRLGDRVVLVGHFPYREDNPQHPRHEEHKPIDRGDWLLHGHVHEKWQTLGRMINVGVDVWGYRPVAASVLERIVAGESAA